MFRPPRCPNVRCSEHRSPRPRFFRHHGYYHPKCRPHPVPRFRCRACGRGFSRQTFRADYRDHRPDLNVRLLELLCSGVGLRQSSRLLGLSLRCTEIKFRKLARHLRQLHLNLYRQAQLPQGVRLQLDELETYETRRNTRPLTLPILIQTDSRFMVWAESATIRPSGRMSDARRRAIAEDEQRYGPRVDRSRPAILRTLRRGAAFSGGRAVRLETDQKKAYPGLARRAFRGRPLRHLQSSSRLPRDVHNPLFPINHTEAMARDLMGRLRRESWLVSKKRECLDLHLQIYMAVRNYVRARFNRDRLTPAQLLGVVRERMRATQLLGWRQDWGPRSIHPLAGRGARQTVAGGA
jgi:transposase-like protein